MNEGRRRKRCKTKPRVRLKNFFCMFLFPIVFKCARF
ncbi:hypothetical protein BVRB_1g022360 [Beta vulgaris subsp. vulgaris]|nr:hypothetical protein BVRB_1g022360 [Beta vulgaris subsp. vulgaris]